MFRLIPHRLFVAPRAVLVEGRGAPGEPVVLKVEGLLCSLCAARVQRALEEVAGIRRAAVDLETGVAQVEVGPDGVPPASLVRAVDSTVVLRPLRHLLAVVGRWAARDSH